MKSFYLMGILALLIFWVSCGKEPQPMDQDQMVNILMDVHIAEGLLNGHHPATMKDTLQKKYLRQVLEKWNTSEGKFEEALKLMHADPDYTREVYELVLKKVNDFSQELSDEESIMEEMNDDKEKIE